jgi:hypothetical protein
VAPALAEATVAAEAELARIRAQAHAALAEEERTVVARLERALRHQGLNHDQCAQRVSRERQHHQALRDALEKLTVSLDSVCGFIVNR